jgi:hypothetical protein
LKRAVLHRKNALFYRTLNGAQAGDLFLIELQRHAQELVARPADWMPWNYRETLARVEV